MSMWKEIAFVLAVGVLLVFLWGTAIFYFGNMAHKQIEKSGGLSGIAAKVLDSAEDFKKEVNKKREK